MARHRVKEEKLNRIRLGSRYFGFNLSQFYWECLKLTAASEELTETEVLRRIIRSWSETLPPAVQEEARAETTRVEAWKALAQAALKVARQIGGEAKWVTTA
jgi:reverse gyrase